jgi:predicted RNA-binding protein with PIN domain
MKEMEQFLVVDGYNIIGAWPELVQLKAISLESSRDRLIEILSEYQSFSGIHIIVVFDAHQIPGLGAELMHNKVTVQYTREKETADEAIERLMNDLRKRRSQVYVATSDYIEQRVTFGKGALRLSARDLYKNIQDSKQEMKITLREHQSKIFRNTIDDKLNESVKRKFEQMRRDQS